MIYKDENGYFIFRASIKDKNGNIIYARQRGHKAFKIYIDKE